MIETFGSLCIISAASGTGKTSLIRAIQKNHNLYNIQLSVSYTTRQKRSNEIHGQDYYFISKKKFQHMIDNNMFLEYAIVFNQYYGTTINNIKTMLDSGMHVILNIDWQGARQIKNKISNVYTIFILPPSKKELEKRLRNRGKDTNQIITTRMKKSIHEITHFTEYDYIIVNDDFETALIHLQAVILSEQLRLTYQQKRCSKLLINLLT